MIIVFDKDFRPIRNTYVGHTLGAGHLRLLLRKVMVVERDVGDDGLFVGSRRIDVLRIQQPEHV